MGNVRNYLARYYFQDEGKDSQGGRKKGPLPSADGLAKALDFAEAWHHSELGRYYQAGKCPHANVMFKGEEEVCELHGLVGVLAQQQKRAGGIIKHNTNAVKNLAATQAVPTDNVDEGSSPEPPAKKAKQPAKPAAGGLAQGRGGAGARAGGGALGSRAGRRAAVAVEATREPQAGRRGGPSQNRMQAEAFNITDVDGGQPAGLLYKILAGTLCRPCKQDAGIHPRSPTPRQPDGRKPRHADGTRWQLGGAKCARWVHEGSGSSSQSGVQISKAVCAFTSSEALTAG
eukprot:jgi/Tetstr1/464844/TSEL_009583.t1